jgi:hypothetical protein
MYIGNPFTTTGYDNMPTFSKDWQRHVLDLFSEVTTKLNSAQVYTLNEHKSRLYKALDLFKDEYKLEQIFMDFTGDIFKTLTTNNLGELRMKEEYLEMLIRNEKSDLVNEAISETLKYLDFMETYYPEKYHHEDIRNIIVNKKINLDL